MRDGWSREKQERERERESVGIDRLMDGLIDGWMD